MDRANPVPPPRLVEPEALLEEAVALLQGRARLFGYHIKHVGSPPDWLVDVWSQHSWRHDGSHWSRLAEFGNAGSDIKAVWELSRFGWLVTLARAFSLSRDQRFLITLCDWLDSWIAANAINAGPNWKCGQEVAIRLLRFLEAMELLGITRLENGSIEAFVLAHLRRINATLFYALGQDNNHGTSEAAAMLIAGAWLRARGASGEAIDFADAMLRKGRSQLAERLDRLVGSDGTFSQYSVNYHRLLLDTLSTVEVWSRRLKIACWEKGARDKASLALNWLADFVDSETGDAPNIGGNDGAQLLLAPASDYRDYRPSLQLASALFMGCRMFPCGSWDDEANWFGIRTDQLPLKPHARHSRVLEAGGFAVIAGESAQTWGVLRFPRFHFRPSHADLLHLDIWASGVNLIRDGGSFGYNSGLEWESYFSGTRSHSTCEFDDRDQMPRLGRFLFGSWIKPESKPRQTRDGDTVHTVASYRDPWGALHRRSVTLQGIQWRIVDEISGQRNKAVLRWRLVPGNWRFTDESCVAGELATLRVTASTAIRRLHLAQGWESRYYLEKTALPVLEVELGSDAARIETIIDVRVH